MHYYKFNISDWALHTNHLSLEEEAVDFRLINHYYDTELPIPLETQSVTRRLRLGNNADIVALILNEFFFKSDNGYIHNRCETELDEYHKKANSNKTNGKLGGRPKKIKDLDNNPEITQVVSENNPNITLTKNYKPLTINHEPVTNNQELTTNKVKNISAEKSATLQKDETELQKACQQTWKFYSDAYFLRYNTDAVRNAKVSSQVKNFVKRIGYQESPMVAAFYLTNNTQYYVQRGHSVDCLLADAEKLRMEWATGNVMTNTRASQIDKSQANQSAVGEALRLLEGVA